MIKLFVLVLSGVVLFLLPLAPAILEWLRPSDAAPLHVAHERKDDIDYFAISFQHRVDTQLRPFLKQAQASGSEVERTLPDGKTHVLALPDSHHPGLPAPQADSRKTAHLILGAGDLALPSDHIFSNAVYADGCLSSGSGSVLRAVLAKGDIDLGEETYVMHWIHAGGVIAAGKGSWLHGRASAGQKLLLNPGCRFNRMYAPRIETHGLGLDFKNTPLPGPDSVSVQRLNHHLTLQKPDHLEVSNTGRWLVRGDLTVTNHTWHRGDLVASADLSIGANAFVAGSVKGNRDVLLGPGSRVYGSVVAARRVVMQQDSQTLGPILAEDAVEIGPGCVVGIPGRLTAISAPYIRISAGALVFGTVWARREGEVLA